MNNNLNPSCKLIVIDNFYNNAKETRDYVLSQEFSVRGNYPGQRTISYATEELKALIQKYLEPFAGKITIFPIIIIVNILFKGEIKKNNSNILKNVAIEKTPERLEYLILTGVM
jgi:hypothetical protein